MVHELEAGVPDGAEPILGRRRLAVFPAAEVGDQQAVGPRCLWILKQRHQGAALDLSVEVAEINSGQCGQCGKEVDVGSERRAVGAGGQSARPSPESRHADTAFVGSAFHAAHAGVEDPAHRMAVVGLEDHQRVAAPRLPVDAGHQPAQCGIEMRDHRIIGHRVGGEAAAPVGCGP